MPLDPKLEKKIDTLYRNTKQMPIVAILSIFVPIGLFIGGPLGLLYWFWRRGLLKALDSGKLVLDPGPPPLPSPGRAPAPSLAEKLAFIRSHPHSLLIPFYVLLALAVLLGALLGYVAITDPRP